MAVLTHSYKLYRARIACVNNCENIVDGFRPRRCMVFSVGMILAGLGIPLLMVVQVLPITLAFGFVGFVLAVTGGMLALTLCGEL